MFPDSNFKSDSIIDIKCNQQKMHRLLIAYETTAITLWSINKNIALNQLNIKETITRHGKCLAVDWNNANEFICGFAKGFIEIYKVGNARV